MTKVLQKELIFIMIIVLAMVIFWINKTLVAYLKQKKYLNCGIHEIDKMEGIEFEQYLKAHFQKLGYHVTTTKTTGDYGADLLLKKGKEVTVVQAKRYQSKIGIKAVQEVIGARGYYHASRGLVVTNSYFTKNAFQLAKANQIELWDRNKLIEVMIISNEKELIENIVKQSNCPRCGGILVERVGIYGKFLGCSNFPTCKFIRNSEKEFLYARKK